MKNLILILSFLLSSFVTKSQIISYDTITFEETYSYLLMDTSVQNIWQIGTPNKLFFDEALSPTHAILTDTFTSYPINNHSFFDILIGNFNYVYTFPYAISIAFNYKMDTDTLKDGTYITYSIDNGVNWHNVVDLNAPVDCWDINPIMEWGYPHDRAMYTRMDTLFNGEYGISGHSDGWQKANLTWAVLPARNLCLEATDTLIVRFNFLSDSLDTQKEGCMIDDIHLFSDVISNVNKLSFKKERFTITPNPISGEAKIELDAIYKNIDLQLFSLDGKLITQARYENTQYIIFDSSVLNRGIYFLQLRLNEEILETQKVIIE